MYEDLRNAVKLLKEYCIDHECIGCPLNRVVCQRQFPCGYPLERFDENVKDLESEE